MATPPTSTWKLYAEDEDQSTVILTTRLSRHYRERFFTMFETASAELATMDRPPVYFRALFYLMSRLDPVQYRRISASEMAQAANMSRSSAERALAQLEADRVIFSKGQTYAKARRLNNRMMWKSTSEKWNSTPPDLPVIDSRAEAATLGR